MEIWRDLPSHFENCVVFTATFHFLFRNSLGVNFRVEEPLRNLALCHKTFRIFLIRIIKIIQVFHNESRVMFVPKISSSLKKWCSENVRVKFSRVVVAVPEMDFQVIF